MEWFLEAASSKLVVSSGMKCVSSNHAQVLLAMGDRQFYFLLPKLPGKPRVRAKYAQLRSSQLKTQRLASRGLWTSNKRRQIGLTALAQQADTRKSLACDAVLS